MLRHFEFVRNLDEAAGTVMLYGILVVGLAFAIMLIAERILPGSDPN